MGSIAGSALYGAWFTRRRWAAWVACNILYALSFVSIATLAGFWPIALGMALAGIGSGLQAPITQVLLVVNVLMAGYALVAPGLRATIRGPRPADELSPAPRC